MINISLKDGRSKIVLANGSVIPGCLYPVNPAFDLANSPFQSRRYENHYYLAYCNAVASIQMLGSPPTNFTLLWCRARPVIVLPHERQNPREGVTMLWNCHGIPHPHCLAPPEYRIVQVGSSLLSIPSPRHSNLQSLKITADPKRADRAPSSRVYTSTKKTSPS